MNIQILPNIFKQLGLSLFFLAILLPFLEGLFHPYQNNETISLTADYSYFSEFAFLGGIILYFLSKEKVEDELVRKLRLEAFGITFLLTATLLFLIYLINTNAPISINATVILTVQVLLFLVIYHFKKRSFDL